MCFPEERREKESESDERGEERRTGKKNKKCNHWFLAVGISSTRETVKTAGGCVCVCVCVCVCLSLSCPVCVCAEQNVCVNSCALLSLKEKEAGRCF